MNSKKYTALLLHVWRLHKRESRLKAILLKTNELTRIHRITKLFRLIWAQKDELIKQMQ